MTHEQTKLLLRELGVEEYVGVGCSRNSVPYFPQTQAGWNVPTGISNIFEKSTCNLPHENKKKCEKHMNF